MGIKDTIRVLIASTTVRGFNFPKLINVFRYLACLHYTLYFLFLDWELMAASRQFEMGIKVRTEPRSESHNLRTSSRSTRPPYDSSLIWELVLRLRLSERGSVRTFRPISNCREQAIGSQSRKSR